MDRGSVRSAVGKKSGHRQSVFEYVRKKYPDCVLRLEVEKENTRAVALYEKCGYKTLPYSEMYKPD